MAAVFKFKADGSQYTRGLNQMRGQTQKFASSVGPMLRGAFAFAGIAGIKRLGDQMDRIQKLSKRFGLDAEVIQRLGFAAEQGGSSLETMAKGIAQANRAAQEAMKGLKTYQRAFDDLEISYTEFAKLNQEEQFMVIADAVRDSTDSNKAMAASQVILGRAGLEMFAQLKDGAQGYRDVIKGLKTFTQEQVDAAARANDAINKLTTNAKVRLVDFVGFYSGLLKGARASLGQMAREAEGDNTIQRILSLFSEKTPEQELRIKLAFEEGVYGQELEDMLRERTAKGMAEGIRTAIDITKDLIEKGTPSVTEDKDVTKKREQIKEQRKSNLLVGEEDAEKLVRIQDEIARGLEEYAEMRKDPFTEELDILTKEYELLQLQNKELALIDKNKKKTASKSETIEKQEREIEAERRRREEIGMSDKEILERRKVELAQAEEAFASLGADANKDGVVDEKDEIFRNEAELDIERRKSEIKDLELGLQSGDTQSIITSSLASIGGGGGVSSVGDPLLGENKKQTTVLEGIRKAIENQNRGDRPLSIPEL